MTRSTRVAEHLARPAIADGRFVQLLPDHTAVDDTAINAVFLPDRHMVPRIRNFIDFMAGVFRAPDWERQDTQVWTSRSEPASPDQEEQLELLHVSGLRHPASLEQRSYFRNRWSMAPMLRDMVVRDNLHADA